MTPLVKGLAIAVAQGALVASLGAKLLYDRAVLPRVWARAAPFDPSLPIRGRYASLQLIVEARGIREEKPSESWRAPQTVIVRRENDRLIAEAAPTRDYGSAGLRVRFVERRGEKLTVLDPPVAFFIPEHGADPSIRGAGEQLWVEVTIPRKGPPRPIQLGVKHGGGPIVPLETR